MSLRKARKILSFILSVIIVIGGISFTGAEIVKYTLCNEAYMSKTFASGAVHNQCVENFKSRISVISAKSNIPERVFEAILDNNTPSANTAVLRVFARNNATLYSDDLVERFESLCLEYLSGNEISYDKDMVHRTALYAAEVYSDCFGIKNTDEAMAFVDKVDKSHGKYASTGLLLIVLPMALILIMFSKKKDAQRALCSAFTALGLALVLIGFSGIIFNVGGSPLLAPQFYASSLSVSVKGAFAASIIIGILITVPSILGSVKQYKLSKTNNE
ncbi:MAG: hypothetical protein J1E36_08635 [Eubacterium sp.]|nr:hypothetical protein [Eubacterium sp.]